MQLVPHPLPMILYCPYCQSKHIDAPEPRAGWENPPHKTHLCLFCGMEWRPCDAYTNGVDALPPKEN